MVFGFGAGIKIHVSEVDVAGVWQSKGTKSFPIDRVITVGSSVGNKIVLRAKGVETINCVLYSFDGELYLENTCSKNNIFKSDGQRQPDLNQPVKPLKRMAVQEGETFFVGGAELLITKFKPA